MNSSINFKELASLILDICLPSKLEYPCDVHTEHAVEEKLREYFKAPPGCIIDDTGKCRKINGELVFDHQGNVVSHNGTVYVMGYTPDWHQKFKVVLTNSDSDSPNPSPIISWGGWDHGTELISDCHDSLENAELFRSTQFTKN